MTHVRLIWLKDSGICHQHSHVDRARPEIILYLIRLKRFHYLCFNFFKPLIIISHSFFVLLLQEVRQAMQSLGISGTKVMRWERDWENKAAGQPFINPALYNLDRCA